MLDATRVSQAEHLPLVAAFLERMGLAAVVNAAVLSQMAIDLGSVAKLMVLGHALREEPPLVAWRGSLRQWTPSCGSAVARHRSRVGHGLETTYRFATAPTRMHNSLAAPAPTAFEQDAQTATRSSTSCGTAIPAEGDPARKRGFVSSIDIRTARATYRAETEAEIVENMAAAHGCRLIYEHANHYGDKVTHTDYKAMMAPGDAQGQSFLNSPLVHNAVPVYFDGRIVSVKVPGEIGSRGSAGSRATGST